MTVKKSGRVTYKRDKEKVEITGESKEVNWLIGFDLLSSRLIWVVLVIILLCTFPKTGFIPVIWKWLKSRLPFLILLLVVADWFQLLLSG